jgi:hypothetical protein
VRFTSQSLPKLPHDPRFADPWLSRDQHDGTVAPLGLLPAAQQHVDLLFPTDESCQTARMKRLEAALC